MDTKLPRPDADGCIAGVSMKINRLPLFALGPLLLAREEWNPRGLEFLIAHGAEPNMQSNNGRTALYVASANGRDRHVEILLASGADPTISTDWGESPLDAATDKGYASVERILLANGATR
jgi:ankyrin repeat protein